MNLQKEHKIVFVFGVIVVLGGVYYATKSLAGGLGSPKGVPATSDLLKASQGVMPYVVWGSDNSTGAQNQDHKNWILQFYGDNQNLVNQIDDFSAGELENYYLYLNGKYNSQKISPSLEDTINQQNAFYSISFPTYKTL